MGKIFKRAAALILTICCVSIPVTANAAVSSLAVSPVIHLDTANCQLNENGGTYYLAATVTPDNGTAPDAFSSNSNVASAAYVKKSGNRYLYSVTGAKAGFSTVSLRYAGTESSLTVKVGDEKGTVNVRVPEGRNLRETAELLEHNGVCSMKQVLDAANSAEFDSYAFIKAISNADQRYYKVEGYLYPDTYNFWKGQSVVSVLKAMLDDYQAKTASVDWQNSYGMTQEQIMTFASLVQAEGTSSDLENISSVFHNRLTDGAAHQINGLQANSTSFYPYRARANVPSEFPNYKSTYSTYSITGLPAGPICSPSLAAINATLHPASTNYYFFCHGKDGTAYFAETFDQHNQNLVTAGLVAANQ